MEVRFISQISDCQPEDWNRVTGTDYPFLRHEFLQALESSDCTTASSGWQPNHALLFDDNDLVAVMPLYQKTHSYGEYVFDWAWADAYQRNGLPYYPKLLTAIPFTPATGPRVAANGINLDRAVAHFCQAIDTLIAEQSFSGWHILFPAPAEQGCLNQAGLMERTGVQYHWLNQNYQNFDDFLDSFKSRQRKNLRKERQRVYDQGVTINTLTGDQLTPEIWHQFYLFYQLTYAKRSGHGGYLTEDFFQQVGATLADQIVLMMCYQHDQAIAAALNFRSADTLYGRYWGATRNVNGLHFEACYYRGIEYCIEQGLKRFDPGAQGEHKIQRGFTPTPTCSMHLIAHPGFREAIQQFLEQEREQLAGYTRQASQWLPFKQTEVEKL